MDAASGTVYLTGNGVRVRTGPGTNYSIIGTVSKGVSLTRTGTVKNGWTQVKYNGSTGYVSSQYLTDTPSATATPAATASPAPGEESSVYGVEKKNVTFADAKKAAEDAGLALATVTSDDDLEAIIKLLNNGDNGDLEFVWLGAEKVEGKWTWANGAELATDDEHWAENCPKAGHDLLLLHKNGSAWEYFSVDSTAFDPDSETFKDKLGYVTQPLHDEAPSATA